MRHEALQDEKAIKHANQTSYGLASAAELPFGGIKASGFGRKGRPAGIYEYLTQKIISQKL